MADTLIDTLQNKEYAELSDNIEKVIARKVVKRIETKKEEVLNKLNGVEAKSVDSDVKDNTDTDVNDNTNTDVNDNTDGDGKGE